MATNDEYWVFGPQKRGGDAHFAQRATVVIDDDVNEVYGTIIRAPQ